MAIGFEHRDRCPLCACESASRLCEIAYADPQMHAFLDAFYRGRIPVAALQDEVYRVVACDACGFIYQDIILDDAGMQTLYEDWIDHEASLEKKKTAKAKLYRQYANQVQTLLQMTGRRPARTRVLDFGMGWGYWSRMAQAHGLAVSGFELSALRREHAASMGLHVIDELPAPGDRYHVVYANQVFEHLPDPAKTLRGLVRRLAPRGLLYIRVPDGRGVAETLAGRGWFAGLDAIHPLEHINCFTRATLAKLGKKAGLRVASPPLRLNLGSLVGGLRREFADRFTTTHIVFRRD